MNQQTLGRKTILCSQKGIALMLTLLASASFSLLGVSLLSTTLNYRSLTDHYHGNAEAFWTAEAGLAEGMTWLSKESPRPVSAVTPAALTDQVHSDQGVFTVTIEPQLSHYVVRSVGTSSRTGAVKTLERSVRLRASSSGPDRNIDFTDGEPGQYPALGGGEEDGYEFSGWRRRGGEGDENQVHFSHNYDSHPILLIKFDPPLAPGSYSIDFEARYTPGDYDEGFTAYVGGDSQFIGDPEFDLDEEFYMYPNMGDCEDVINCGEGNFVVVAHDDPIYLDDNFYETVPGDLDGDGDPDDIRGHVVIIPRDYDGDNPTGSLHFKNLTVRPVVAGGSLNVEQIGWGSR